MVVASLSSTYQDQARVLRNIAAALADQPLRGLITLGPALTASAVGATAANVELVASVSHAEVLPQARAMITHCGHGTVMKALVHGLPIVCMPMGRDQNDNAARIVARGAGIRLRPDASARQIRAAVERALGEPSFAAAAAELGRRILAEASHDRVRDIEALLTSGETARGLARIARARS